MPIHTANLANSAAKFSAVFRGSKKIRALASGCKKLTPVFVGVSGWLALLASAWLLAAACALAFNPPVLPAAPAFSAAPAALQNKKAGPGLPPASYVAALESNNLFNLKSRAPTGGSAAKELKAILMGTVEAVLPEDTRAIVQHQGKQHLLRPGQSVDGFVLREARRGRAVFEGSDGRLVELAGKPDLSIAINPRGAGGAQ